jgi:16S rRNA (adenine1518-N6/adenine1519-N6)-dimethyltransferase
MNASPPRAKKRFGQNFLVDENVIGKIIRAVSPQEGETIVEIGPGRGALTKRLVESKARVIAIEYDRELIPLLREEFAPCKSFTLIESDALKISFQSIVGPGTKARVVANLPYYISTAILQKLIEERASISEMTLMLQREVVERATAQAGMSERGFLSVLIEAYCKAEKLFDVAPSCFRPVPKVWSAVARFSVREKVAEGIDDEDLLLKIVSAGFAQRRKTIFNNLRNAPKDLLNRFEEKGGIENVLNAASIGPQRRAETLTLQEWARLSSLVVG